MNGWAISRRGKRMTEAEWLTSDELAALMEAANLDGRKLRLFAAACARALWHLFQDEASRAAIVLSERSADQVVAEADLDRASGEAERAFEDQDLLDPGNDPKVSAASVASYASNPSLTKGSVVADVALTTAEILGGNSERVVMLFRDVVGDPFRRVCLDPAWLTPTVVLVAQAAYDERILPVGELDAARLAVLADALEDAGCADAILSHLRSPGPHVRGCWALDLVLGKS